MKQTKKLNRLFVVLCGSLILSSCTVQGVETKLVEQVIENPGFQNVSVHDPSIVLTDEEKYIIGSHMGVAKTDDLIKWHLVSESVATTELFEDIHTELAEEFQYAQTDTLWASDIIQLEDGRYYMYYCLCEGASPRSVLGVAVADDVEGPYKKVETFLHSGSAETPDGKRYDATIHPNAIDPHVFFDKEGELWMVYGSYSGGIYILPMNRSTGLPLEEGYGTKLMGGNHSRIEGPYMLYNAETDYYYLFVSFGGLDATGAYNIRVARSKNPDGPFVDMQGQDMIEAKGPFNSFFDDKAIEGYGTKLIGNYVWDYGKGNPLKGYNSPGHNSAYYDEKKDQYFMIFHTRFIGLGERHEVRAHTLLFNEDGWPMITPRRYAGEVIEEVALGDIQGDYMVIEDQNALVPDRIMSQQVTIEANKLTGAYSGKVELGKEGLSTITFEGVSVKGQFLPQWDDYAQKQTMTFTGLSDDGTAFMLVRE